MAEPLSSGAMGAVYRAVDTDTGTEVALKQSTNPHNDHRFEVEARLLASLQHPRVVRVVDSFSAPSGQFLVMELVRGVDLGDLIKRRGSPGLPVEQAVEHVRQTCEALQYVHDQQIIHRDVKPQNMILGEDGIVLVDFGIARQLDDTESSGTVGIGTPRFMAPEVFAGGQVSPRTDVFGVAATLWTLIAGRPRCTPTRRSSRPWRPTSHPNWNAPSSRDSSSSRSGGWRRWRRSQGHWALRCDRDRRLARRVDRRSRCLAQPDGSHRAHRGRGVRRGGGVDLPDRPDHR